MFLASPQRLILQIGQHLVGADGVFNRFGGYMGVLHRGRQLGVAQEHLNDPHISVRLQQVCRKTMAQRVQCCWFGNARHVFCRRERPVELARRDRFDLGLAGEQPSLRARFLPILTQQTEQTG